MHVVTTALNLLERLNVARTVLFRCLIAKTPLAQSSSQSEPMFIPRRSARAYGLVDIKPMGITYQKYDWDDIGYFLGVRSNTVLNARPKRNS
ncbi:hypothetical protein KOW79_011339 [Hemibagrus wyckioides]|uniref:Uncharacterized protein n=1 Tax=Hemibagrus wyckioides TaxID=337641 RepID=A0A9D3SMP4_9TELE|nr:hypothetical protein KOW79_011339 [Hemibagrus wyckioides]